MRPERALPRTHPTVFARLACAAAEALVDAERRLDYASYLACAAGFGRAPKSPAAGEPN